MAFTPTDPLKAEVRITGTAPNQALDFYIPRGAKGEPGGLVYGTSLTTSDLNSIVTSGIYRQTNAADGTQLRNYPINSTTGILTVKEHIATSAVLQTYEPVWGARAGKVFYQRQLTSGTWSAWQYFAGTRVDQTAGRAIYQWDDLNSREQLVFGDTGWRDVAPDSGTVTWLRVRRTGSTVFVWIHGWQNGTSSILYSLPVGFQTGSNSISGNFGNRGGVATPLEMVTTGTQVSVTQSATSFFGMLTFSTIQPWPTTLPGTASGSIPNA